MNVAQFYKRLKQHFGIRDVPKYLDKTLTVLQGRAVIDVIAFDDYLHEKHGEYEERGLSMHTLLIQEYGESASEFVSQSL